MPVMLKHIMWQVHGFLHAAPSLPPPPKGLSLLGEMHEGREGKEEGRGVQDSKVKAYWA